MRVPTAITIDVALDEFLVEQRARLAESTYSRYADVVGLLRDCLNRYAYQSLSDSERRRWKKAFDAGDEEAFCALFGPDRIVGELGSFLDWFMVRKAMAGDDFLRAAGTVTKKLARWLAEHGHVNAEAAAYAVERASDSARGLPAARRLTDALTALSWAARTLEVDVDDVDEEDWVEDSLTITRVEPGLVWLGEIGPLELPKRATGSAQVGWEVYVVAARVDGRWRLLENGLVYT